MSKKLGLIESKCLQYIGNGVAWLMFGLVSAFDNFVCDILAIVCLLCGITAIIFSFLSKEKDDEMSKHNMMKAKSRAMDLLKIIICVVIFVNGMIGTLHTFIPAIKESISVNLRIIIPIILGIVEIMIGYLFLKYEREGE